MLRALRRLPLRAALLACCGGLAAAAPAAAQHPVGPRARALHARLAQADAIAVATVTSVEDGRIRCSEVRSLAGEVPSPFRVKRAPGAPPPLAAGDRALLLLRGARPPYVLVDEPDETIRLADPAAEERWSGAIAAWLAVRERPAAWIPLYVSWIDGGPETLRELAARSLTDPGAPFQPVPAGVFAGFGAAAFDPARSLAARRAFAKLAFLSPEGGKALAEAFLAAGEETDPVIAQAAVGVAPREAGGPASALLLRGLAHPDAEVRRAALVTARKQRSQPGAELRAGIEALSRDAQAESWLRAEAEQTLAVLPRAPESANEGEATRGD